jgi:uncharacterized protein (TIGR00255 family)
MTGFGRGEYSDENRKIAVEIKAVNHRYLDLNIKMPKKFNFLEHELRSVIKQYVSRGKVDIFVTSEEFLETQAVVHYNPVIAAQYMECAEKLAQTFGIENDIRVSQLARFPEVLTMEEQPLAEEQLLNCVKPALVQALEQFNLSREKEGAHLQADLLEKCDLIVTYVEEIKQRSPQLISDYRTKLEEKVKELLEGTQIEESRIAAEVTIYADKICVDEEIVRLLSHANATKQALSGQEAVGRKLDFIAQEMNREANTILSKSNDLRTSEVAISLKTEIEKIREQIQNIE